MKSILEPVPAKECYECGAAGYLEEHHIFFGAGRRKLSERYGMKVHLCLLHHRDQEIGVHGRNTELRRKLEKDGQQAFEQIHSRKEFIEIFGQNYLD